VCFSDAKAKAVALDAVKASAVDTCEWSASRTRRKGPPVPTVQEAGWAPEPVWTQRLEENTFATVGDRMLIARSSSP
jgi:hypothetical protein